MGSGWSLSSIYLSSVEAIMVIKSRAARMSARYHLCTGRVHRTQIHATHPKIQYLLRYRSHRPTLLCVGVEVGAEAVQHET